MQKETKLGEVLRLTLESAYSTKTEHPLETDHSSVI